MKSRGVFTKVLAVSGAVLVWFPIAAPVLLAFTALITKGRFLFDFLMPAELFPLVLLGGGLLFWAALRAHTRRKLIGWGLGTAAASLVLAQGLAVITGLASGEHEAEGWRFALVLSFMAVFWAALLALGVGGVWLLREIFKPPSPPAVNPSHQAYLK
ncbi:MAG: hypothetical protein WHV66_07165 [Anaerolineales bacterium]|jgi:hypothetical protein